MPLIIFSCLCLFKLAQPSNENNANSQHINTLTFVPKQSIRTVSSKNTLKENPDDLRVTSHIKKWLQHKSTLKDISQPISPTLNNSPHYKGTTARNILLHNHKKTSFDQHLQTSKIKNMSILVITVKKKSHICILSNPSFS